MTKIKKTDCLYYPLDENLFEGNSTWDPDVFCKLIKKHCPKVEWSYVDSGPNCDSILFECFYGDDIEEDIILEKNDVLFYNAQDTKHYMNILPWYTFKKTYELID